MRSKQALQCRFPFTVPVCGPFSCTQYLQRRQNSCLRDPIVCRKSVERGVCATYSDGGRKQKNIPIGGNQPLHDNLVDIQSSASQNLINGQQQ
jgi:hypothetical protein